MSIDGNAPPAAITASGENTGRDQFVLSWLKPAGLIGLSIVNFLLRTITLGVYYFWGKTEVRRRIWSGIKLNDEPLVYTGRGGELFLGFLIVFGIVLLPLFILPFSIIMMLGPESPFLPMVQFFIYGFLFFLFGLAIYRALRYRLSRTTWRGIRGRLIGNPWNYAATSFWTILLLPLTLGWAAPWRSTKLQKLLTNDMRFGSGIFAFEGTSRPLYRPFAVMWLGTFGIFIIAPFVAWSISGAQLPPMSEFQVDTGESPSADMIKLGVFAYGSLILGILFFAIISAWYRARMINHFAACTSLQGVGFSGTLQGRGLIYITVTNFLIRLVGALFFLMIGLAIGAALYGVAMGFQDQAASPAELENFKKGIIGLLGVVVALLAVVGYSIFSPITEARRMGYFIENLDILGGISLDDIMQGSDQGITAGEGLAEAFDVDAF